MKETMLTVIENESLVSLIVDEAHNSNDPSTNTVLDMAKEEAVHRMGIRAELLEALKSFMELGYDEMTSKKHYLARFQAEEAIAKAEGK